MKRTRSKQTGNKLLTVWIPAGLEANLSHGARKTDSDKSKFVRNAIREKLARHGVQMPSHLEAA